MFTSKKIGFLFIWLVFLAGSAWATHQKAAEITYRHVEGNSYDFELITYTFLGSQADRPSLEIKWRGVNGGGESLTVYREEPYTDFAEEQTRESHYKFSISFPGTGTYIISMEDPNRNGGVVNLPNSLNTPIYVETTLVISPFFSSNSSPTLLNKPMDVGCLNIPFMHNPGAFDPDGDSLSFKLIECKGANGLSVPGFRFPNASNSLEINAITGDLIWDAPTREGEYNLAILIEEFRKGVRIGTITRDMQINIQTCDNRPPQLIVDEEVCAFVGDTLRVPVTAIDVDSADSVSLFATGGLFLKNSGNALFSGNSGLSPVHDTLVWIPQHADVQEHPHPIYFRAKDNGKPNLNTLKTLFIQVVADAPTWDSVVPTYEAIALHWTPILDENIYGYRIFRASDSSGMLQENCDFGMKDAQYQEVATISDYSRFSYLDTNTSQNFLYCYRILAVYRNGTESKMSDEICVMQLSNTPILEVVSVIETDENYGKIQLAWRKPLDFDIVSKGDDFQYKIYRMNNAEMLEIQTITNIHDTTYLDEQNGLNTKDFPQTYTIELLQKRGETWESVGFSNEITSIFANATGKNKRVNVQWQVAKHLRTEGFAIFRKKESQSEFDSIAHTKTNYFTDTDVINDSVYTYKIKAFGRPHDYRISGNLIENWSQETTAMPQIDTPCTQELTVDPNCKPIQNHLEWGAFDEECLDDELTFHIFYNSSKNGMFREIDSVYNQHFFEHENTFVGCYFVTASNVRQFHSAPSDTICVLAKQYHEMCMNYALPNVFTPNGDGVNDFFKALPNDYAGTFTIKIFNRWGGLVFESNDTEFTWDGVNRGTKQACPEGVYFYVVELVAPLGEGFEKSVLKGHVTLLR